MRRGLAGLETQPKDPRGFLHVSLTVRIESGYEVEPNRASGLRSVMTDGLFASSAYKVYGKIIVEESYAKVGQMATLEAQAFRPFR